MSQQLDTNISLLISRTNEFWHDLDDMLESAEGDVLDLLETIITILSELRIFAMEVANFVNTDLTNQMHQLVGFRNRIDTATAEKNETDWGDDDVNRHLTDDLNILRSLVQGDIMRVNQMREEAHSNEVNGSVYVPSAVLRL